MLKNSLTTATVVVSCYSQEKYIRDCLESILSQKTDFDFDILVSDDCSEDSTQSIIQEYADKYPEKFNLILRDKNVGPAINYIEAHNSATGDVVFHIDGDDIMLPYKLQEQFSVFRNESEVNVVFHKSTFFSDDGSYKCDSGSLFKQTTNILIVSADELARWGPVAVHSSYAYRRKSRKARNLKRDFMEWFFAMDSLSDGGRAAYIDKVLVKYRCNPSGASYLSSKKGQIKVFNIYLYDVNFYFKKNKSIRTDLFANYFVTVLAMLKSGFSIPFDSVFFLLKNIIYFRLGKIYESGRARKSVAPAEKVR